MAPRAPGKAPGNAPGVPAGATLTAVEMRLTGGMLALNRLVMTFMNKRMPIAFFTVGRDGRGGEALRATVLLECPEESARRYAVLLGGLEDIEELEVAGGTLEVALLDAGEEDLRVFLRESAAAAGIETHETEPGGTLVASGEPESMERWLGSLGEKTTDIVRLGPVVRPGDGG